MTDLLYKLVCGLIEHGLDADERAVLLDGKVCLEKLPETVEAAFETICRLATEHLLTGCKCASYEDSLQFLSSSLKLSKLSLNESFRFGLVDFATDSTAHCYAYQFIHPLVTEFLAGFYLRKLPPVNQLTFLFENSLKLFENGFTHWLTFFFGFTSDVFISSQTAFINRTKLMMNSQLIPIHYLGPEKKSPLESMSMSDRHNAERHNGGTMEVILMLRPLPKRINFVVPSTNEEVNLILSNDISNDMSAHNNSSANADFSEFEERVAVVRCMDEFDATRDNTLPSLQVVPKILTGRAQHTLPKPFVHPAQAPRVDSILPEGLSNTLQEGSQRKSDSIQTPGVANLNDVADFHLLPSVTVVLSTTQSRLESLQYGHVLMNRHSPAQTGVATSIQPSHGTFVHISTAEQAVGEAQQSLRLQANLRQGTVLYTSVPDKIPSDRIQPQHTLIRKGGNGSIFSENVNGLALAVKKTSYRSKEYAIFTKIHHKNMVPLYVWGEEHKESKRRFYVLPKLSGDMARLVTDKEELSLHDGRTSDVYTSSQTAFFNPTKLMMNSLKLDTNRCDLIRSLDKAQEKSMFRKLSSKQSLVLTFSMPVGNFDSVVSNSGMPNWIITTSSRNERLAASLKAKVQNVVIYDDSVIDRLHITPKRNSAELDRLYRESAERTPQESMEKSNQLICRAVREILQRVFPLYSAVKLKGDSSNISYVSFLTCKCFEESLSKCVQMYLLIPIHYLGPGIKTSLESMSMPDRHNAKRHNGGTVRVRVEVVRPLPERIKGVVPSTNENFDLILSNDVSAPNNSSVNGEFKDCVAMVVRCMDEFDATRDNAQMILLSLQVARRAQHALPNLFVRVYPTQVDSMLPEGLSNTLQEGSQRKSDSIQTHCVANLNMGVTDFQLLPFVVLVTTQSRLESLQYGLMNRHSPAQTGGATSIPPSRGAFVHSFTAKQAVGVAQQSPRRQANLRQGTVLYTSVPDKIPSDRIQPLPTQHTLIRKGGNGSVFSENVNGLALAVKKTSYRSKEYTIITKIRHKNIVPLLAYVWGEKHKKSKRKFYVYHFLPKFSGDMARLVTDKEELSLHDFHQRFHNNPREMGVAVGNVKYILSQVLQGLHYLHDSHRCIHRDVKASNVLIKFFCNCDNPVQCSCDVKYQVVICDFDAALELDSLSRMPPTTTHSSRSQAKQYEIVPVGTNGFRSPEFSMLMIANSPEAFSPPLSTKADIYSFGILSMRLMMSTDTPYSQRAMSTLLLYYHQSRGVNEGRLKRPSVWRVDERTVLKLLKLHKLNTRMKWLKGAYDFVNKCVSVDPEARPSASSLLKDPFLNTIVMHAAESREHSNFGWFRGHAKAPNI